MAATKPTSKSQALVTTSASTPAKNVGGRPRANVDLDEVRRLAGLGLSAENIADRLGISRRTLFTIMGRDPSIRAAMDEGLSEAIDHTASKLRELIDQGNLGACIFFLRSRSWIPPKQELSITVRHPEAPVPTIDGHVFELAEDHRRLLDGPNPDDFDGDDE